MPSPDVLGAHYVLRQSNPGRTHRLSELLEDAPADELTVRREIDALALDGQVKRLYVGDHVMVSKTDEFDPENAPDVNGVGDSEGSATALDLPPLGKVTLPDSEGPAPPEKDEPLRLTPLD